MFKFNIQTQIQFYIQINVAISSKTTNDYIMMHIAHIKSRSIFQLLTSRVHQIRVQNLLSNYFGALYLDKKIYPIALAKFSRRSLTREAIFAFEFSISHSRSHVYSVYNCFLLPFCGSDSKSSVPYFFSFIHHSPSVVVISPSSS